jgi:hypothetical protein
MKWSEGGQFENPPSGTHVARCIKLIDLGTQPVTFNNETKYQRKVVVTWELPETLMEGLYKPEFKGKPFAVSRRYTQSLDHRSALRRDMESWRGRQFTKEELAVFDPKGILGKPCMVNLVEEGEHLNVAGISPMPKTMQCPKQINPSVYLSLERGEFDAAVFASLPDKVKEKIVASPEYKALNSHADEDGSVHNGDDNVDPDCPF